jgi:predicted kinase
MTGARLIIFSGLPGTGKTTIAGALAARLNAVYLRADTIETALRDGGVSKIDGLGYMVGYATARENLQIGNTVIADSVNPWQLTRDAWRAAARDIGKPFFDVEVICSDKDEPRRRVENRSNDIPGLALPSWQEVVDRDYDACTEPRLEIDTAVLGVEATVEKVFRWVTQ